MSIQAKPVGAKRGAQIVIDIGSSPEPTEPGFVKSASRSRTTSGQANVSGKGKGKAKAKSNKKTGKVIMGPVIELTDSESDSEQPGPSVPQSQIQTNDQAQAGPSRPRPKPFPIVSPQRSNSALAALPVAASLENIPVASGSGSTSGSQKKRKAPQPTLFLPSQSDEENKPPVVDVDTIPNNRAEIVEPGMNALVLDDNLDLEMDQYLQQFHEEDKRARQRLEAPLAGVAPVAAPVPHPHMPEVHQIVPPIPVPVHQPIPAVPPPQNLPRHIAEPVVQVQPEHGPQSQGDPMVKVIAQVLEIMPDVDPDYLRGLVETHLPNFGAQTTEHILGLLFENGGYPRVDRSKGKRKATVHHDSENPQKKMKVDYASKERNVNSPVYHEFALIHLQLSFPLVPKPFLRRTLEQNNGLYAPTHFAVAALHKAYADDAHNPHRFLPYIPKTMRYNPSKDLRIHGRRSDKEFAEERKWLIEHLQDPTETKLGVVGTAISDEAGLSGKGKGKEKDEGEIEDIPLEDGTGIECQCCFSEYAFDRMVQCPEAHLFCSSCVSQYAATKLGEHNHLILCMHASGCSLPFTESELRRILSPKLMSLYERVKQQKEIEAAGLEGLEECPFCEWKCVLEASNEEEKLFRCGNEEGGCGVVSCRSCKKKDHLPKSCKEAEEDKVLDGRHAIEEAMTRALMRNCPKCNKAFVKETGCNKMTCPHCRTLSCYVCRKVIDGYQHFDQMPGQPSTSKSAGKCRLWDNVEERHALEVRAAAEKAAAEYKRDHPEVSDEGIKIDLPAVPPPAPAPQIVRLNHAPHLPHDALLRGIAPQAAVRGPILMGALPGQQVGNEVARPMVHPGIQVFPARVENPAARQTRLARIAQQHREYQLRLAEQQQQQQQQQQIQQQQQEAQARIQPVQEHRNAVGNFAVQYAQLEQQRVALQQQLAERIVQERQLAQQRALGLQQQQRQDRFVVPPAGPQGGIQQRMEVVEPAADNFLQRAEAMILAHEPQQAEQQRMAAARRVPVQLAAPGLAHPGHMAYEIDALRRYNEERAGQR
ncbi:E3 ubiquitin-protein ligase RNF216 [Psilocybe cubensis]|uniref:E3 ubiquitin-protein ligase RNF216 n=1 Tax=Psilocybe cubensis TaxID=181762 RepID=A0ACB8H0H7_PSICU|nr:E3 ubiquitin-protein ligase RNF216 [Psilocybe cubensis]KAH9481344.1 E3 ubiquitin-protein ligase RNF216 [Psilocybe cubensis]